MDPTLSVILLWLAFSLSHIALSSLKWRPSLIAKLGDKGFMGVYSLVALATFVPMVSIYFGNKHSGPLLWSVAMTPAIVGLVSVVMLVSMIMLVAGIVTPSPSFFTPGAAPNSDEAVEATGIQFITRHAVFMATGLFGLVHLIPNGYASDVAFFAGFPVFAVIGCVHQDQRKLITDSKVYPGFYAVTALIPFTGKHTLRGLRELPATAWLGGIAVAFLLRYFHVNLFG